jgi:hypothetical protein
MPRGPRSRAIDSDRIRWAALVEAKPAKFALPRTADVLPVSADAIRRTGQGDHAKSSGRKTPDNRGPRTGTDTRHESNRLVSHGDCLAQAWTVGTRFETALAHQSSVAITLY